MDIYETFVAVKVMRPKYPYSILSSEKITETHKNIILELDEVAKVYKEEKKRFMREKGKEQHRRIIVVGGNYLM
jgi:hypothetical protein